MRICLIGDFSPRRDESRRVVAFQLAAGLRRRHQVLSLHLWEYATPGFWKKLRVFRPEIIHYVPGMSPKSLALMKIISLYCRDARTVISAMRPYFPRLVGRAITLLKPDLVLTQSYETEIRLKSLGCATRFLSGGVDTEGFAPVSDGLKSRLREKHGISSDRFVVLHVGSIKPGRGVRLLAGLQKEEGVQVVIVGPTSVGIDKRTQRQLEAAGCIVRTDYFEDIAGIYNLADCYIYPTVALRDYLGRDIADSAEMPISVLEAMACNLPVITTRFGALPRVFAEGDGLIFAQQGEIPACLRRIMRDRPEIRTRQKVLPYSWSSITQDLEDTYRWLLRHGKGRKRSTFICFTGMDGAGKTTLARYLSSAMGDNGLENHYVHSRLKPFISRLPMQAGMALFLRGKKKHRSYGEYAGRKKRLFRNRLLSQIYSLFLSVDYFFQVFFKIRVPLMRGRNIVCDRYVYDTVILDLAVDLGYSPDKTAGVIRSWLSFLPEPDLVFLLDAPEEIIFARKNDIPSLDYTREVRSLFLAVAGDSRMVVLDSSRPVEEVAELALDKVMNYLSLNGKRRVAVEKGVGG